MNVLVVEDDPVHCRLIASLLDRWGYPVRTAGDGEQALRVLEENTAIQLAIVDWMMPKLDGIELCREIRRRFNEPYLYLVLLTSRDQRDDIVTGFDAGADDYLIKPVHHTELSARLRAAKRILDLQEKLLAAQETLRVQAMHDALTGIWNRGAIFEALGRELDRTKRQQSPLAVIMIDLDHFKQINDRHGHLVGDQVLREAAQRIRSAVRSYDSVGRYGGEEFLLVAPGFDAGQALEFAERVRRLFATNPIVTSAASLPVTMSLGVVVVEAGQELANERVLAAADDALYRAKSGGRDRAVLGTVLREEKP
ncbi:MAG: diguanylate cyclase [Deltaproteobacteria bacterium]|nr:diguanylate cyclase [Deltaproteobacteria bacterium]